MGDPATNIVTVAPHQGANRIIMGSRGRSGLAHVLLGSVAEKVVRTSPVPVMALKGDERQSRRGAMEWRRQSLNYPPNYDPVESAATIRIYDARGRIDRAKTRRARREYLRKMRDIEYAWRREAFLFGQEFSPTPPRWRRRTVVAAAA